MKVKVSDPESCMFFPKTREEGSEDGVCKGRFPFCTMHFVALCKVSAL